MNQDESFMRFRATQEYVVYKAAVRRLLEGTNARLKAAGQEPFDAEELVTTFNYFTTTREGILKLVDIALALTRGYVDGGFTRLDALLWFRKSASMEYALAAFGVFAKYSDYDKETGKYLISPWARPIIADIVESSLVIDEEDDDASRSIRDAAQRMRAECAETPIR